MKNLKNANGMSLVAVMFIIVLFSVVGITLMSLTTTNAKQIQKVEQDMQAVDIAEMGIVKYRNELIVKINENLKGGILEAIDSLEKYKNENPTSQIDIIEWIVEWMKKNGELNDLDSIFQLDISGEKSYILEGSDIYYIIQEKPITKPDDLVTGEIIINYSSTGYTGGNSSTIDGSLVLVLGELIKNSLDYENENIKGPIIKDPYQKYATGNFNNCTGTSIKDRCHYKNDVIIDSDIKSTTAIIDGDISDKNGKNNANIYNSHLLVNGDGNIGKIKDLESSTLYFSGTATFGEMSGSKFTKSMLYAKGGITMSNFNNKMVDSFIFSGGDMKLGNVNFDLKNTKIYVAGDLTTGTIGNNKKIDNNSLICVTGEIKGDLEAYEDGEKIISQTKHKESFNNLCLKSDKPSLDLIPEIVEIVDKSDYIYQ